MQTLLSALTPTEPTSEELLWPSARMWRERIDDSWVLFAPDRRGLPVVVSDRVMALFDRCSDGVTASTLVDAAGALEPAISRDQAAALVAFLRDRSFLRHSQDPARYQAKDVAEYHPDSFSIWLHINNHCNLDCAYCFVDKSHTEMSDSVMDQTVEYLADTVRSRGIRNFNLKFAGGEPTLSVARMELFSNKLQRAMTDLPCTWHTSVLSNGTVMSDRLIAFLQRPRTGISISIDGYGPAGHDIFRVFKQSRRGSWEIIERNIAKARQHGIVPYILATISQESAQTLPELVRWVFQQGLKMRLSVVRQPASLEAYSAFRSTATRENIDNEYRELTCAINTAFEKAFEELEQDSYELDLRSALSICELHFDSPSFASCCGIGLNHLVINEKGEAASCPMTVHRDTVELKPDVLESVQLTFARHSPKDREKNQGKNCLDCRWFPVCVSGCPINNLAVNGRPYSVSPLNPFYEYVIPRYIRFFARKLLQSAKKHELHDFLVLAA
jgi:uncharacterized protein